MSIVSKRELAALEVSAHWDELNLSKLLVDPDDNQPHALPPGMMNMVISTDLHSISPTKSAKTNSSPVKVTKEVIVQRHKKRWEKANYSVLKDRYGAQPHKPPCIERTSLERLADPIKGRYASVEDYEKRVSSAREASEGAFRDTGEAGADYTAFLTGLDDAELSPGKIPVYVPPEVMKGAPKGALTGGEFGTNLGIMSNGQSGFFLTATEDASPLKQRKMGSSMQPERDALGAATAASRNRGGRVNGLRKKVEEAGRTNRANQVASRLRSTSRAKKIDKSVLGQGNPSGRVQGTKKSGGRTSGTAGRSSTMTVKSSGYGAVPGMTRHRDSSSHIGIGFKTQRGNSGTGKGGNKSLGAAGTRGKTNLNMTADEIATKDLPVAGASRGRSTRHSSTLGDRGRSTSRSRGASVSRTRVDTTKSVADAAQKRADVRTKAQASRAGMNSGKDKNSLLESASHSKLRSASAVASSRNATVMNTDDGSAPTRSAGGGLAAIRERKQVSSAPVLRRGKSVERPNLRAMDNKESAGDSTRLAASPSVIAEEGVPVAQSANPVADTANKAFDVIPSSPLLPEDEISATSAVAADPPLPTNKKKVKGSGAAPLSKKELLKSATNWRPTSDILKTLEGVQQSEAQRGKAHTQNVLGEEGAKDAAGRRPVISMEDKENKRSVNSASSDSKSIIKSQLNGATRIAIAGETKPLQRGLSVPEESLTSALMEKANRLKEHFEAAGKGFVADDAEVLAQSIDTTGVPSPMRPRMALLHGPQSGRIGAVTSTTGSVPPLSDTLQRSLDEEALARAIAADRIVRSPLKII